MRQPDDRENHQEEGARRAKSAAAIAAGHDDGKTASGRFRFLSRQLQAALHELRERRDQLGEVLAQAAVTSRMAERYRAARQPVP